VGRRADCEGEEGWVIRLHDISVTEILGIFLFSSLLAFALKLCSVFSFYLILVVPRFHSVSFLFTFPHIY